jgi:hypothetical protein
MSYRLSLLDETHSSFVMPIRCELPCECGQLLAYLGPQWQLERQALLPHCLRNGWFIVILTPACQCSCGVSSWSTRFFLGATVSHANGGSSLPDDYVNSAHSQIEHCARYHSVDIIYCALKSGVSNCCVVALLAGSVMMTRADRAMASYLCICIGEAYSMHGIELCFFEPVYLLPCGLCPVFAFNAFGVDINSDKSSYGR